MADFNLGRGLSAAAGGAADFVLFNAETERAKAIERMRQKGASDRALLSSRTARDVANIGAESRIAVRGLAGEQAAAKDTRPAFVRTSEALGFTQDEQRKMFSEQNRPRGTQVNITNVPEGFKAPTKTTETNIQKELINLDEQIASVESISLGFEPSFQTIGGKWSALKSRFKDRLNPELLSDEERIELDNFTQHRARSGKLFARILSDMSGAAVTPQEAERQKVWLPNPGTSIFDGDSPTEFRSKVDRMLASLTAARTRNVVRLNMGLSLEDAASQYPLGHSTASDQRSAGQALEAYGTWLQQNQGLTKEQAIERVRTELGIRR